MQAVFGLRINKDGLVNQVIGWEEGGYRFERHKRLTPVLGQASRIYFSEEARPFDWNDRALHAMIVNDWQLDWQLS